MDPKIKTAIQYPNAIFDEQAGGWVSDAEVAETTHTAFVSTKTALYFLYIRVPRTAWFTQVLLYWDVGAAIVPEDVGPDKAMLGQYMTELVRARLVRLVRPDEALSRNSDAFEDGFRTLLDAHDPPADGRRWMRLHTGKIGYTLLRSLAEQGLARRPGDPELRGLWWVVERSTAELYLAYLAGAICGVRDGVVPVTDADRHVAALGPPLLDAAARLRALRYTVISRALPMPSGPVPAGELASFKERHGDELRRLRRHLDGRLADVAAVDDEELRRAKTRAVVEEISDDVAVLREQMDRRRWPKVTLVGVGGVMSAALTAASAATTGAGALAFGLAIGGGAAAVGGAAYQVAELARSPCFDRRAPFVYAARIQNL